MDIPAFCDTCGTPFRSGIVVENSTDVTLGGGKTGPCPNCGGYGTIIRGTFNVIGDVLQVVAAPQRTIDELQKLAAIFEHAKRTSASAEDIATSMQREIPELSSLRDMLPKTRTELYAFLTLMTLITNSIISTRCSPPTSQVDIDINVLMEQSVQTVIEQQAPRKTLSDEQE